MAKKIEKNGTGLGEISTIRDILMGQQINEYESRFLEIQNQILESEKRMNQHIARQITDAEERMKKESEKLGKKFTSQIEDVEGALKRCVKELRTNIDRSSDQERVRLGQLLADLSNQLLNGK